MEKLYEDYGRLLIEAEIINSKIMEIKRKIVEEMNKKGKEGITPKQVEVNK